MGAYNFDWGVVVTALPDLLSGVVVTAEVAAAGFAGALLLGLPLAAARRSRYAVLRALGFGYIQLFRSMSTFVFILWIFFGLTVFAGLSVDAFTSAVVCLAVIEGAFVAEIYRAALAVVDSGQAEAAQSLGLGRLATFWHVLAPQALRTSLPALVSQLVLCVKGSSVIAIVGGGDLMRATIVAVDLNEHPFELYTAAALLYVAIVAMLGYAAGLLERRLARSG